MAHLIRGFTAAAAIAIIATAGWTTSSRAEMTGPGSWMGVKVVSLNGGWRGAGVRVTEVEVASPADRIGIEPGDILVAVGWTTLKHEDDLTIARSHVDPGKPIPVVIARDNGSSMTIKNLEPITGATLAASATTSTAAPAAPARDTPISESAVVDTVATTAATAETTASMPTTTTDGAAGAAAAGAVVLAMSDAPPTDSATAGSASDSTSAEKDPLAVLGLQVTNLNHDLATALGDSTEGGVLVLQVTPGEGADRAGIHGGDVITTADKVAVSSPEDLASALRAAPSGVSLHVFRRGDERDLTVSLIPPPTPPTDSAAAMSAQQKAMEAELKSLRKEIEELRHQVAASGRKGTQ
jgi:C-terminal processing protease CtpA/Prc